MSSFDDTSFDVSVQAKDVEFTAKNSGYFLVWVDGVKVSQHITEREALEKATNALNATNIVKVTHDYEVSIDDSNRRNFLENVIKCSAYPMLLTACGSEDNNMSTITVTTPGFQVTPDQFTFTDQPDVPVSTTRTSLPITVTGINISVAINVSGSTGLYDINNSGVFTNSPGTVNNGDTVRAQHTSTTGTNQRNTIVTIGGVSDTFTSTTLSGGDVLLFINDISYLGAFTMPVGYEAYMLGKGKDADTLYAQASDVPGDNWDNIAVVSNPGPGGGTATEVQSYVGFNSASDGWYGSPNGGNLPTSLGFYYYEPSDVIFFSHCHYYPSGQDQLYSVQQISPTTLLPIGNKHLITGGLSPQQQMGNFGPVPSELQAELGGDTFMLGGPMSITGYTSNGVSVLVFDGSLVDGSGTDIPGTVLSEYAEADDKALFGGSRFGHDGSALAESTAIDGGAFIEGTRTFMAWGAEGIGPDCYGTGAECGDPCSGHESQGNHAQPYRGCLFFFDIDDFVKVKNSEETAEYPVPYNRQNGDPFDCRGDELPTFPLTDGCGPFGYQVHTHYDPATKRFYVGDRGDQVYVFQVTVP